ncbi:uncharacterized protein G2W53_037201 [Senna tora]|uniref:Uncharacterized protein n=1 Tax=Senna tora TaxID=362788 RepID=A0A834STZ3_9FABA|nr:uncharacterized protein G2W53_037201 [Senna tora]
MLLHPASSPLSSFFTSIAKVYFFTIIRTASSDSASSPPPSFFTSVIGMCFFTIIRSASSCLGDDSDSRRRKSVDCGRSSRGHTTRGGGHSRTPRIDDLHIVVPSPHMVAPSPPTFVPSPPIIAPSPTAPYPPIMPSPTYCVVLTFFYSF